ncbi:hypothetical protein CB0940_09716 [Cercospora beticola]|uniref:Methylated-DNA--protein-cysteine methyltransferase n=1 Tax=Cercospora beticola TaxID=122368 RepID=A0A2G5HFW2_CERBT|nr:hypothetical protein CB0940_09716 [Cercospora beticola]PIA91437.1 hypothetical protein CB0940_09716 [Cercospora beticola]WPB05944.1 hypothetical protein RHO25_010599 [Cercospora beticola]CAK1365817.1 unnamed protein product [Cercospora beticola]
MAGESKEQLQDRWNYLYKEYLPALAKARDESQPTWPVFLDHCFARIVLDNAVGVDKPWTKVLKSPAYKHMSEEQLGTAIELAEKIAQGSANLVELDEHSLQLRGKQSKKRKATDSTSSDADATVKQPAKKSKNKSTDPTVSSYFLPISSPRGNAKADVSKKKSPEAKVKTEEDPDMPVQVKRIQGSNLTAFKKKILTMLTEIPRGRWSTYGAMSDYLNEKHSKTCARAVGSAIKNNPFAPEVPCHRILAADRTIGGFKCGGWGESGKYAHEKHQLLKDEGVKFDSSMKVKGSPFRDFSV